MSGKSVRDATTMVMRKKFELPKGRLTNAKSWFPRHMFSACKSIQYRIRSVDMVVEVHDARIPFTGRNQQFRDTVCAVRPHVLILNKSDLIDPKLKTPVENRLFGTDPRLSTVLWTDFKSSQYRTSAVGQLMKSVDQTVRKLPRFNRILTDSYSILVIGIPNVGKSTLLNAVRGVCCNLPAAAAVGPQPGVTKSVQEKIRIRSSPLIYMIDTPGVLAPSIDKTEDAMKLSLCETISQHHVGVDTIADYLLFLMNQRSDYSYLRLTDCDEPTDDIFKLLFEIALRQKFLEKKRNIDSGDLPVTPNMTAAAHYFLSSFRGKRFGCQFLDHEHL